MRFVLALSSLICAFGQLANFNGGVSLLGGKVNVGWTINTTTGKVDFGFEGEVGTNGWAAFGFEQGSAMMGECIVVTAQGGMDAYKMNGKVTPGPVMTNYFTMASNTTVGTKVSARFTRDLITANGAVSLTIGNLAVHAAVGTSAWPAQHGAGATDRVRSSHAFMPMASPTPAPSSAAALQAAMFVPVMMLALF